MIALLKCVPVLNDGVTVDVDFFERELTFDVISAVVEDEEVTDDDWEA